MRLKELREKYPHIKANSVKKFKEKLAIEQKGNLAGDQVERLLEKIKIGPAFKNWFKVRGKDCGCEDRKLMLNDLHAGIIINTKEGLEAIAEMYTAITGHKVSPKNKKSQCASCWKSRLETVSKYLKQEEIKHNLTKDFDI